MALGNIWVSPNTFILDTTIDGSDRNLTEINPTDIIPHPPYPPSPNIKVLPSWESKYFLYNNSDNPLPAGTEFGIELSYNNKRSPDLLNGLFLIQFNGVVDVDSGAIRTTDIEGRQFSSIGGFVPWEPKISTPFITEDDLQPGEAISLSVKPFFNTAELNNQVPPNSVIGVLPVIRTQSGSYNPIYPLIGDAVFNIGQQYRVLPGLGLSFEIGSGVALVKGYSFPQKPKRSISGLLENTSDQKVVINGNGAVYLESPTYTLTSSEALRASVSTAEGESALGEWSAPLEINNGAIAVSFQPENKIREDYPDVIKGTVTLCNASAANIYLQRLSDGAIRKFGAIDFLPQAGFNHTISDWGDGVDATPAAPDNDFCLFAIPQPTLIENTGSLSVDSYRVAASYQYSGDKIASISHASPPCIKEWYGAFEPPTLVAGEIEIFEEEKPPEFAVVQTGNPGEYRIDLGFYVPVVAGTSSTWNDSNWDSIDWDNV